jgi:hypothetical protein
VGELTTPIGPNTVHLCIDMQRLFSGEGLAYGLDAARDAQSRAPRRAGPRSDRLRALSPSGEPGERAGTMARLLRKVVSGSPSPD